MQKNTIIKQIHILDPQNQEMAGIFFTTILRYYAKKASHPYALKIKQKNNMLENIIMPYAKYDGNDPIYKDKEQLLKKTGISITDPNPAAQKFG
jgi:hypothetical protein